MDRNGHPWIWKAAFPGGSGALKLFCFPFAGGGASAFRTWQPCLLPSVQVCPVQLPGRENRFREPACHSMDELIPRLLSALEPHLEGEYALYGHSMGALIALELARRLQAGGAPHPRQLIVSASPAPHLPRAEAPIHELPDERFKAKVAELDGTPREVLESRELMDLLLPTLRADFALCRTYASGPPADPLRTPITIYGGIGDRKVKREHLEPWQEWTRSAFRIRMFPGGHFFISSSHDLLMSYLSKDLASREPIVPIP